MLEAIKYNNRKLEVLDQLKLPHSCTYQGVTNVTQTWEVIRSMKVRGAPAIANVAVLGVAVELNEKDFNSKEQLYEVVKEQLEYLQTSRPTAINLRNAANRIISLLSVQLQDNKLSVNDMKERIIKEAEDIFRECKMKNLAIGEHGASHIINHLSTGSQATILTHCNTGSLATAGYGTALGVIRSLHLRGMLAHVYCTETRPYNQGARLTAFELMHDKIPSTLICDSMVAALMKSKEVSAVVVGADRVVANGDTANKIGTYQIAVCAKYHKIPFYVALPVSTVDLSLRDGGAIPIEERPSVEMTYIQGVPLAPTDMNCWNPAFDVTPAELITGGIITERGVFKVQELEKKISTDKEDGIWY
ncbi:methylthioribose-1-phosphate isomerase-like isoform X2 [Limulus polyphemus]|uniref:Methylthioribose-1-phosphate isomerase n=1 Tax=Limulus polyphemus TaxID=6850 RepID=A0ABM1B8J2_LIMPO|nr:methylthioribose-1-phosphate isomerase-like isoform X2 [Limulus polyphemus]